MGDFWDDIKKKNEERRIAGIKSDIRALEEQLSLIHISEPTRP